MEDDSYILYIVWILIKAATIFCSMLGKANLRSYIWQESDYVRLQPGCLANSFMLTQVHSHLSCVPPQLAYADVAVSNVAVVLLVAVAYTQVTLITPEWFCNLFIFD